MIERDLPISQGGFQFLLDGGRGQVRAGTFQHGSERVARSP